MALETRGIGDIISTGGRLTDFSPKQQNRCNMLVRRCFKGDEVPRPHQVAGLQAIVSRRHTCVVAGTGSGKSRIQLMAICWFLQEDKEAIMVVIQPTRALALKQVSQFQSRRPSLNATWYNTDNDIAAQRKSIEMGLHRVILLSPEVASGDWFKTVVRKQRFRSHLKLVVIDHDLEFFVAFPGTVIHRFRYTFR